MSPEQKGESLLSKAKQSANQILGLEFLFKDSDWSGFGRVEGGRQKKSQLKVLQCCLGGSCFELFSGMAAGVGAAVLGGKEALSRAGRVCAF